MGPTVSPLTATLGVLFAGGALLLLLARRRPTSQGRAHASWLRRVGLCGTHPLAAEIATAVDLALSCGAAMLQTEGASASFKDAGGIDPTTATDLSNERLVLETLRKRFPAHAIISEEDAHVQGHVPPLDPSTPTWIVDPIDGTQNFCHGLPLSCVSIGLCEAGVPVLGVVYHPHTDELYVGVSRATPAEPAASYLNGRRLRAAPCESLHEALIMTCFGYERSGAGIAKMGAVVQNVLAENTFALRVIGSSVLGVCWVAAGRASGVYHGVHVKDRPKPWDWCAAHAIATAAGASFHRIDERPADTFDVHCGEGVCACTSALGKELQRVVLEVKAPPIA